MAIKGLRPFIKYNENRQVEYLYFICRDRSSYPVVFQAVWIGAFAFCNVRIVLSIETNHPTDCNNLPMRQKL